MERLNGDVFAAVPRRQAHARAVVARRLMLAEVGEAIPTMAALAAESGTGTGTVQAALAGLRDVGAVQFSTHGHQGTTLIERDLGKLWSASSPGPLTGILPLPGSIEFSGLATAVSVTFEQSGVPATLAFRLGSRKRIDFLTSGGADFIACSLAFARTLGEDFASIDLGPSTYYTHDSVAVITRAGEFPGTRGRIAIDRQSHDHEARTKAEFPKANFVESAYPMIPDAIVAGRADAAVWHRTSSSPIETARGIEIHPLSRPEPDIAEELSHAALVTPADGTLGLALLASVIDPDEIARVQQEVAEQLRVPSF